MSADGPLPARRRVVVVGTGALGSAAAYWLSRRLGEQVLVLEQFRPGHTRGASEDHSRIIRHSYGSTDYTNLTRAMFAAWEHLAAESGVRVVLPTGGLDIAEPEVPGGLAQVEACAAAMEASGIPFERLDGEELMRRWPQWQGLAEGTRALFQPDAGILDIRQACAAHLALAQGHGATVRSETRVTGLEETGAGGVLVHTDAGDVEAGDVVLCTGKWLNHALGSLASVRLEYTREQVTYFATPRLKDFAPERFPIWIHHGEPCFYGFPVYGTAATKAAEDLGGPQVEVDDEESPVDPARIQRVADFLARRLPGALGPVAYSRSCVYDLTPDRDFLLGALPGHPHVFAAVGAGHAGKFAALIGQLFSELVLDGGTDLPIEAFSPARPALR